MHNGDDDRETLRMVVCPECGRHAHYLFDGDRVSGEFLSQNQGKDIAKDFRRYCGVSQKDFERLMRDIQQSGLPMEIPQDVQHLLEFDEKILMFESKRLPGLDEGDAIDSLHELLVTFFPEAPRLLQ